MTTGKQTLSLAEDMGLSLGVYRIEARLIGR
jgi:hypothetical protein